MSIEVADPGVDDGRREITWSAPKDTSPDAYDVVLRPSLWHARVPESAGATVTLPRLAPGGYDVEVRAIAKGKIVAQDEYSLTVGQRHPSSPLLSRVSWGSLGAQALAAIGCALGAALTGNHRNVLWDLAFAFGVLTMVFAILQALGRDRKHTPVRNDAAEGYRDEKQDEPQRNLTGLCRVVVANDGRVSASELQTALWTWLVAFLVAYFTARSWFDGVPHLFDGLDAGSSSSGAVWPAYLGLLGGPFVALVAARGIDASKTSDGSVQKATADDSERASLKQALTNDNGSLSVINTQYLVFNLVALAYVIAGLASTDRLPAIPGLLVSLTGSSAGAYVLNKAVSTNGPSLVSVVPAAVMPGEDILLLGNNLIPAGAETPPMVTIGGIQALVRCDASSNRVTVTVPVTLGAGPVTVVATTFAQVATSPCQAQVLPDEPKIFEAAQNTTEGKTVLTLTGGGLGIRDRTGQPFALLVIGETATMVGVEVNGVAHTITHTLETSLNPGTAVAVRTLRGGLSAPSVISSNAAKSAAPPAAT